MFTAIADYLMTDQQCLPVTDVTNGFIMVALSVQQKMTHNGSAMIVNGSVHNGPTSVADPVEWLRGLQPPFWLQF